MQFESKELLILCLQKNARCSNLKQTELQHWLLDGTTEFMVLDQSAYIWDGSTCDKTDSVNEPSQDLTLVAFIG